MWRALRPFVRDGIVSFGAAAGWSSPRRVAGKLTIATFHRVLPARLRNEYPMPELAVTPEELDWCLAFFCQHFRCTTVSDGYASLDDPGAKRPALAVTFDDGQLDNLEHARPVLDRHGVPATFYVVADAVGQPLPLWHDRIAYAWPTAGSNDQARAHRLLDEHCPRDDRTTPLDVVALMAHLKRQPPEHAEALAQTLEDELGYRPPTWDRLMDWSQVRTLAEAGHEIGAHSSTHAILPNCDDARLEHETVSAKHTIEKHLGREICSFCYPNGDHDDRVVEFVRRAGFANAVTTNFGHNPPRVTPYHLRRCDIQSATSRDARGRLSPSRLAWRLAAMPGSG